jgi:HEAT repeat protein
MGAGKMPVPPDPQARSQTELIYDLNHGTPSQQAEALSRLTAVGDAEALDAVVEYLQDTPAVSGEAGLGALQVLVNKYVPYDRYGLADVLISFIEAGDWQKKLGAVRLLSAYPNELAVPSLRVLIDEARDEIVTGSSRLLSAFNLAERTLQEAIIALASCGRVNALPDILELLDDPGLRPVATRALGLVNSETERLRLEDLCEDDDVRVRDSAQWALGLMDERIEQLSRPPDQIPEPPPDRLSPIYWAHRCLFASDDDLLQFLIVRMGIEHLILDHFIGEGRVPEQCRIIVRSYQGSTPPGLRSDAAETVGAWRYNWVGPRLRRVGIPDRPTSDETHPRRARLRGARILITYPETLSSEGEGLVGFDCLFGPSLSQGYLYHVAWRDGDWTFALVRHTWSSR